MAPRKPAETPKRMEDWIGEAAATSAGEKKTTRLNVNVPADLYEQFAEKARSEGRSITWLITRYIQEYVSKNE